RSVRTWQVPEFGSKYATMKEWCAHHSLAKTLAVMHPKWNSFVSFVSAPPQVCPEFSDDPKPITVDLAPVPPLEDEMIPDPLRDWIVDIATRAWAPTAYAAAAAIVALSGLIGCRLAIRPKRHDRWLVCPNL